MANASSVEPDERDRFKKQLGGNIVESTFQKAMEASTIPYREQAIFDEFKKQLVGHTGYCPCGSGKLFKDCCGILNI